MAKVSYKRCLVSDLRKGMTFSITPHGSIFKIDEFNPSPEYNELVAVSRVPDGLPDLIKAHLSVYPVTIPEAHGNILGTILN